MRQQKSILIAFTLLAMMTGCKTKVTTVPPINLKDLDQTVKPGTDFYQYANGGWIKSHPLKPEYSRYGSFDVLDENNQTMIKDLVIQTAKNNNPAGSNAQKIGDFYYSGM
ncbi:MAG: M13 family metallopeptidase N-terminal domain-containing protein, partial [Bacteroidota bacterium]|nr:M13 family metallopeptidase N-terminal domain-containing protein [Bacteroidota bacterium]